MQLAQERGKFKDHSVHESLRKPPKSKMKERSPNWFLSPDLGDPNQEEMVLDRDAELKSAILMADVLGEKND